MKHRSNSSPTAFVLGLARLFRQSTNASPQAIGVCLFLEYRLPLGCLVHMTPVFQAIKRSRPEVALAVATRGLGLEVLRHSPYIDHLMDVPDPTIDLRAAVFGLRKQLRARSLRPDCVLTGASDQRTRIGLLGMLATGGWLGGYTQAPALYARPLAYDAGLSLIGNNLRVATMLGCPTDVTRPRIFASAADAQAMQELLRAVNPAGRPVAVFVTQNSRGQQTGWHVDRFAAVIRHAERRGFAVVYVGTTAEQEAIDAVRGAADGIGISVAGRTTVSELVALLAMSDVMVTLDTGTMHVGRAAGVPMVILGPSWQKPIEWMPLGVNNVRILRGPDTDNVPDGYRLDEIAAESATAAMEDLLKAHPPSMEARRARVHESLSEIDHLAVRGL